jgi:branched-chain amino acid transport system substrate-binding protein
MIAAKPDAMMIAGVGADAAMPHTQLVDAGYKGPIFQTHGAASGAFLQIGGKKVEGALIVGPLVVVPDEIPDSVVSRSVTLDLISGYEKAFGSKPPIFSAGTYDAGLLLARAIPIAAKSGKPGSQEFRSALRDALESTREMKASQGVINMSPADHSGYDMRGQVLLTVKDGKFTRVND